MHQPRIDALRCSVSPSGRPVRISSVSTTDRPRLSLPPGVLCSRFCTASEPHAIVMKWTDGSVPRNRIARHALGLEVSEQLVADQRPGRLEALPLLDLARGRILGRLRRAGAAESEPREVEGEPHV